MLFESISLVFFEDAKVFDSTMVLTAVLVSWVIICIDLVGVGKAPNSILVGLIVKFFVPRLGYLDRVFTEKP